MKSFPLIFSFALLLLTSSRVLGATQCPGNVVSVKYHSLSHSHIGISATVNGSGPYEFLVDTGAQITVIEPSLARDLKVEAAGSLNIVTVASRVEAPLVTAVVVEVGPVSVRDIRMAVEDLGPLQVEFPAVRGILGTNFLSRFDMLIDNRNKILCFDDARRMQLALSGEHMPILPNDHQVSASAPAVLVSVHLPDDGEEGSVLRLDSGSNVPLLYTDHQAKPFSRDHSAPVQGSTIGRQAKFVYGYTPERNVRFGTQKHMQIVFATPIGNGRLYSKTGEDGVLPTTLFKRVFISAADHFVIFDPH